LGLFREEKTMRIGMMTDMYTPYVSGVITYIGLNQRYLEKLGHEVFVITFGKEGSDAPEDRVVRSPGIPVLKHDVYFNVVHNQRTREIVKSMDVVHVHHPFTSGINATYFGWKLGLPVVFTHHTRYDLYAKLYMPGLFGKIGEELVNSYLPSFYKQLDALMVPSASLLDMVMKYQPTCPVTIQPHGMELDMFKNAAPLERGVFGFTDKDVILIYVGRLGPEKNLDFLLETFEQVSLVCKNARLLLVGDGPIKSSLEDWVGKHNLGEKFFFTGMISHDEIAPYYATADIFVTSSTSETFGLTVVEAMASGLPVVGIQSPGISDAVVDGQTGFVTSQQLDVFSEKLICLVEDTGLRREMAQHACQHSDNYAIEKAVERLVIVYQEAIAHRRLKDKVDDR
jgi:1,2-diacylglycerol 3-alpha-glucosyltransferase